MWFLTIEKLFPIKDEDLIFGQESPDLRFKEL
jgi:hypothetical protein